MREVKKKRVLRVDDGDAHLLTAWLAHDGHEVTEADGAPHALALAAREQFDLIVVHQQSPEGAVPGASEILESIGDAFFSLDAELRFTYVNRKAEELWGVRREELLGRTFLDVFPHAAGSHSHLEITRALDERRLHTYETVSPILGRWVEVSAYPSSGGLSVYFRDVTERKRAEEAIRRSEAVLAQAGQMANLSAWEVELSHTDDLGEAPLFWSDQVYRLFGYEPGSVEVSGDLFFRHVHRDDRQRIGEAVRASIAERKPYGTEYRIERADGVGRIVQGHAVVEVDEAGRPRRLIGTIQDITERKAAEEALRESEKRFRATFEQAAVGVAHSSLDGRLLLMNRKLCDILGYTPEEILTKTYQEVTHPEDLGAELESARRLLAGEIETASYEKRYIRKDGSAVWVNLTASVVRDEAKGEPLYFVAIIEDISARKAAEEALGESEEFNRRIVESSSDCIKILDLEGGLLYISPRGQELLGIEDPAAYLNGSWVGLWPGEGQRAARAALEQAKTAGVGAFQGFGPTPQGQPKWWDTVITPMTDARGQVVRLLAVSRDITESKRAEEALRGALAEVRRLKDRLQEENVYLREEAKLERHFGEIVGGSDAVRHVLQKVERVAPTGTTVLITGETGTGKELVARAIHQGSLRRDRPLVKVNCAALPSGLIESELFGHERGAFTGATTAKKGRFELADGATLFLDEIGELPPELQAKLLRVLQEGEFERLGSARTIKVDVRVIAATNRELWKEVQAGRFRADLWYRLNVYPITVPPLRQRREDIPPLVEHFVAAFSRKMGKAITSVPPATLDALRAYSWPGNVRELANVIERAVITGGGPVLQISNFAEASPAAAPPKPSKTLEEVEREYITSVLEATGWKIDGPDGAARILKLHPNTLRGRMAKMNLREPRADGPA